MKLKFNVTEITEYGNGGGTKVILMPSRTAEENKKFWDGDPSGKIEMHFTGGEDFTFGEYDVEFAKKE